MISDDNLRQYHIISDKNIRLYQTMIAFWSDDDLVIRVMTLMVIMMMMEFIPLSWWWNYDYDDNRYLFLSAVLYVGEKSGKELGGWGLQLFHKLLQHFNDYHQSFQMLFGMMTIYIAVCGSAATRCDLTLSSPCSHLPLSPLPMRTAALRRST